MRMQKILVGVAMFVLLTTAAYAEFSVSSTPVTTDISSGRAEYAGNVRLTVQGAATVADFVTIRYGYPITVTASAAAGDGLIAITAASTLACTVFAVDNPGGVVTLNCPAGAAGNFAELSGVRLALDAQTISGSISVQIGTLLTPIVAGQNTAVVINSVQPGLAAAATGASGTNPIAILASNIAVPGPAATAHWYLTEPFASAWKTLAEAGTGTAISNGVNIRLTLSGLPAGVTVTIANDAAVTSPTLTLAFSGATFTSTTTQRVISFTADSQGTSETIGLTATVAVDPTVATLPLAVASYTISASLDPVGVALTSTNTVPTTVVIPRFAAVNLPSGGFTILTIVPSTTSLLIPYVSVDYRPGNSLDTGIAVANTTSDPFGVANGGAVKQSGTITFNFFPSDGTAAITYTTAAGSPGFTPATTDGKLAAGQTWVALLSQVLAAAGYTKNTFTGYAIITINTLNGHGVFYISNFSGFSAGQSMLVIPNPATVARVGATESLGN